MFQTIRWNYVFKNVYTIKFEPVQNLGIGPKSITYKFNKSLNLNANEWKFI